MLSDPYGIMRGESHRSVVRARRGTPGGRSGFANRQGAGRALRGLHSYGRARHPGASGGRRSDPRRRRSPRGLFDRSCPHAASGELHSGRGAGRGDCAGRHHRPVRRGRPNGAQQGPRGDVGLRPGSDEVSSRSVEPVGVVSLDEDWYLVGWCRLRSDARTFRLDRIRRAELTDETAPVRDPDRFLEFMPWLIERPGPLH